MVKENFIYVGIDLHKETHTAVMIDCYNQKLGEITFPNRPADFPKLVTKVKKCNTDAKEVVYGLENAYGYGRPLAVWLIDKGYFVKDVNTAISHRQAKHRGAMYRKSDSDDAEAIALATLNMLDKLPDACPNVNLSQYKKIENQWAKAISEGKEVTVNIDIKYDGDGFRPIEFNVEYTIDGDFFSQSILN